MNSDDEKEIELCINFDEFKELDPEFFTLWEKLESLDKQLQQKWKESHPGGYADARKVVFGAFAEAFAPKHKGENNSKAKETDDPAQGQVTITIHELARIKRGLLKDQLYRLAEKKVEDAALASSEDRDKNIWRSCAEIMGLKPTDRNFATFHEEDECIAYVVAYEKYKNSHLASKHVFKQYPHKSLSACKKWIFENVGKRRDEAYRFKDLGIDSIFYGIPLPSKSDTYEEEK